MATGRRSPNYPQLSLEEALQRVEKIYKAENTHKADKEVIAKVLGYNSLNGTSLTIIGALNRYELLQADGDGLKVSGDAVDILLLSEGEPQRVEALQRCAFAPQVFADLHSNFGETLPSDSNLRHFLVTKKSFLDKAADEVIRIYRQNWEFIKAISAEYTRRNLTSELQQPSETPMRMQPPQPNNYSSAPQNGRYSPHDESADRNGYQSADLRLKIGEEAYATIKFEGVVTQEGIAILRQLLEIQEKLYPPKETLNKEQTQVSETEQQTENSFAEQVNGDPLLGSSLASSS